MSYRIVWNNSVGRAVRTWALPDAVFVEMRLRVNLLGENPATRLVRVEQPVSGMLYPFRIFDPSNRLCEHLFAFHVLYSQDEETLFIARGTHVRRIG